MSSKVEIPMFRLMTEDAHTAKPTDCATEKANEQQQLFRDSPQIVLRAHLVRCIQPKIRQADEYQYQQIDQECNHRYSISPP